MEKYGGGRYIYKVITLHNHNIAEAILMEMYLQHIHRIITWIDVHVIKSINTVIARFHID